MSETFSKIHCNTLKFQDKPLLRIGQKSALQLHCFDVMLFFTNLCGQHTYP